MERLRTLCFLFLLPLLFMAQQSNHLSAPAVKPANVQANLKGEGKNEKQLFVDSLKALANAMPSDTSKVRVLLDLCLAMQQIAPPDEMMKYAVQAAGLAEELINGNSNVGIALQKMQTRIINFIGILYLRKGEIKTALSYMNKALALREKMNDREGMCRSYINIGAAYSGINELQKATEYQLKALAIAEQRKDSMSMGYCYYVLSRVNSQSENYRQAQVYGERSLAIRQKINDLKGILETFTHLGSLHYYTGNYPVALEYELKALAMADSMGSLPDLANNYNNIANIFSNTGKFSESFPYYENALQVYGKIGDSLNIVRTLGNLGRTKFLSGDFGSAKRILLSDIEGLKKYKQTDVLSKAYLFISKSDSAMGNYQEALLNFKNHVQLTSELMENEKIERINELQLKYESEKNSRENLALKRENELQLAAFSRNRLLLIFGFTALLLIAVTVLLMIRQGKYRAERRVMQLEHKLLRLQMNPHFIYNSLQAIQNYILKHNEKESVRYLSAFASLTREVLENSRCETIPLHKEITLLKNYLQLQKLRFGNRFDFEINVPAALDTKALHIPPMLSQPFIENAVEHGLKDVEKGGRVEVSFKLDEGALIMEISDNGRGMDTHSSRSKDHASLAMAITRERINLINKKNKRQASFIVNANNDGDNTGVRIRFTIPLDLKVTEPIFETTPQTIELKQQQSHA